MNSLPKLIDNFYLKFVRVFTCVGVCGCGICVCVCEYIHNEKNIWILCEFFTQNG